MIVDGVFFDTAAGAGIDTTLVPVESGRNVVLSQPNPRIVGCTIFSPTLIQGTVHGPASFGGTDPEIFVPPKLLSGPDQHMYYFPQTEPLIKQDTLTVKGTATAAEDINGILNIAYDIGGAKSIARATVPRTRGRKVFAGAAVTANVFTNIGTLRTDLKAGKNYALVGAQLLSTNARAIRFKHADFMGRTPTLKASVVVANGAEFFEQCPIFSGDTNLDIEVYCSVADTPAANVFLGEM